MQKNKRVKAGYSISENGLLTHYRTEYDLEKVIYDTQKIECLKEPFKSQWIDMLKKAYSKELLKKDIETMKSYSLK